jgi:hypothetical protein
LQHASADLHYDLGVVLAAVSQNGHALHDASADLRGDLEVVLPAIAQNGFVLDDTSAASRGARTSQSFSCGGGKHE